MWDRTNLLILIAATVLAGCEAQPASRMPGDQPGQDAYISPQGIDEEHVVSFNRAVEMASELRYEAAAAEFIRLIRLFERLGAAEQSAEAIFWLGYCYEKIGRPDEAKVVYSRCLMKYPRTLAAEQAAFRVNRIQMPVP